MTKRFLFIFIVCVIFSVVYHLFLRPTDKVLQLEKEFCSEVLPVATEFSDKTQDSCYIGYRVENNKKIQVGIVFNTGDIPHNIYGYADKIDMLVGISNAGVIQGVKLLKNKETPGFFQKVLSARFFEKFRGKKLEKPLISSVDVDGVTGATVSSAAIIDTINASGGHYVMNVLNIKNARFPSIQQKSIFTIEEIKKQWYTLAVLAVVIILGILAYISANEKLWIIQAVFTFYFLGFHFKSFLSILNVFTAAYVSVHVLTRDIIVFSLAIVFLMSVLFIPRFFCGYVCPFGGLMRLVYKISQRNWKLPEWFHKVKYYLLASILIIFTITLNQEYVDIEPFIVLFNQTFTTYNIIYITAFVGLSVLFAHFWCNYFCTLGALGGVLSKLSLKKKRINENCAQCELCIKVCPHNAIQKKGNAISYDPSECFSCQECVRKCPKGAIS